MIKMDWPTIVSDMRFAVKHVRCEGVPVNGVYNIGTDGDYFVAAFMAILLGVRVLHAPQRGCMLVAAQPSILADREFKRLNASMYTVVSPSGTKPMPRRYTGQYIPATAKVVFPWQLINQMPGSFDMELDPKDV